MPNIRTVLGDVDVAEMGFTMPHEHIFTSPQGHGSKVEDDHMLNDRGKAIEMLEEFKSAGGHTIVEATPETWGRDASGMRSVSEETGVHVIACTGYICQEHGMQSEVTDWDIDYLAEVMVKDLTEGMDGTDVLAGWIKAGSAYLHITPNEEKVIRAACRAATEVGCVVHTHTTNGTMGIEQTEIAEDENFDMSRMIIAHVDRQPDAWYHRKMVEKGVSLIYDGPGKAKYYPDSIRIDVLKTLVAEGFEDQIMLTNDMGRRSHHKVWGYGPGWTWIKERFLPRLLEEGFTQEQIDKFMISNPARMYAFTK
jgi:predicted metal-dependent phosphotriesterase family hydrolase